MQLFWLHLVAGLKCEFHLKVQKRSCLGPQPGHAQNNAIFILSTVRTRGEDVDVEITA